MTKVREIYRCQICGNVVEVVNPGAVLSCCGEPMKLMKENTNNGKNNKQTGETSIKIPVESKETVSNLLNLIGKLFAK